MTVAEIAEKTGKSERGVKSMLSRRGLVAKDYDGAAKRAKLDAKAAAAE
ncbi:putative transcription factor D5 [Salmonella phage STP-SP2]|nr:putative transcription factor D5 [Salmonella phage STP-SP2]